jgi:(E)-benzylidenesuccinyl-CoA hydratase
MKFDVVGAKNMHTSADDHVPVRPTEFEYEAFVDGILVSRVGRVAVVLFDRPERGNACTRQMLDALPHLWRWLDGDPDVRAMVLGATGRQHFSTGIDVRQMAEGGFAQAPADAVVPVLTSRQARATTPLVCAIEGLVVGGGLHFPVDADIVVASETARFFDCHVNIGQVAALETIGLAHKVGVSNALYLALVGRGVEFDATRAFQLGLVQEVVPTGRALARALELAQLIARNSPSAVQRSAEAIWGLTEHGVEEALGRGWDLIRDQWAHPDSVEGPRAYTERRPPQWID